LTSRTGLLLGTALVFAAAPALAHENENFALSSPFEVGDSPTGNYLAGLIAGADRDTVAAATFFREALRADPRNPQLLERTFVAAVSNGNMDEAFGLADRLLARDPSNGLAHLALGVKLIKAHQYSAARAQLAKNSNGEQGDLTATLLAAWTYAGNGQTQQAINLLEQLHDPSFTIFRYYHEALIADVDKDTANASKAYESAYQADKNTLRLVDAYARFLSRQGKNDQAEKLYEDFSQVLPDHPMVTSALAQLKAGKKLDPFITTPEQGAGEVLYGLGAAGGRQGDELASLLYLRFSLYLDPDNSLAILMLGDFYERTKEYEQAIDVYETVPDADPLRLTADIETAQVLENLGRTDEATKYLDKIASRHPDSEDVLSALGNLERAHKHYAEAVATYSKAIDQSKKAPNAIWPLFYFRGISYERQKQWPPAEADFKHALELFPDQPLVLNYLAYSWVDQGSHLDEAFPMLRRAVELRPTDGYIVDSLGWADYKLGHYDEAVKELERAVDLKPGDPVINDHLGDAYWQIGRKLEAHFQWNHARDLNPEPEDLPRILQKIEHGLETNGKPAAEATAQKSGG
jgi:tetratricopeptide (TPR) repeat protein